jgi:hypothetical protein
MSNTCASCKWFKEKRVDDWGLCCVEPPVLWRDNELSAEVRHFHRCAKWETKRERKCGNCEFFKHEHNDDGWCHRYPPARVYAETSVDGFCGEFKGRE